MNTSERICAALGYIPVIGWLFVLLTQRNNKLAIFHVRQAIGLVLFLAILFAVWALFAFVISQISYGFLIANALFALVFAAFLFGIIALVGGISNALRGKPGILPIFGRRASRLPIGSLR
jgi:uncharacterized membrane protein